MTKICTKCNQEKPLTEYHKQKATKDGHRLYCKSCIKIIMAERYIREKSTLISQVKDWQTQNQEKRKSYQRKYQQKPIQRIKRSLRKRIKEILGYKDFSMSLALGCTPKFLRQYLESKFQLGMTWNNYGEWHIDHIKPLASFNLQDKEQRKLANHYTNLQPLWAADNMKKGDT